MFAATLPVVATKSSLERATRIELAFSAWEADVLPLNYARGVANDNPRRSMRPKDAGRQVRVIPSQSRRGL